jgi:small-conductance mechanosensitive channel
VLVAPLGSLAVRMLLATTPSPTPTLTPTPTTSVTAGPTSNPVAAVSNAVKATLVQTDATCVKGNLSVCGLTWQLTGLKGLGQTLQVVLGVPLKIFVIVVIAILLRRLLQRVIRRSAERIAAGDGAHDNGTASAAVLFTRRQARARTLASVLSSSMTALIVIVAILMVMQEVGLPTAPLLASASVIGVALGLGAQSLIRDIVSGVFMIAEDQYGVGDVIDVGEATGSVEAVGLRITRLRDVNGTVWYVRNGEILRVGNQSQGWARAVLDVNVGLGEDLDHVQAVLLQIAEQLRADPAFGPYVLGEPEVWGVESLTVDGVLMRVVVKTQPLQQWTVARELRKRIKNTFDADGIEMKSAPRPMMQDDPNPAAAPADPAPAPAQPDPPPRRPTGPLD